MKQLILPLCLLLAACTPDKETVQPKQAETAVKSTTAPVFFQENRIEQTMWKESAVFKTDAGELRGIPGKLGFTEAPFQAGKPNKYVWFFFSATRPVGEFAVVGVKQGTKEPVPVLVQDGTAAWTAGSLDGSGAWPSLMLLPSAGNWTLYVYVAGKPLGEIMVGVK